MIARIESKEEAPHQLERGAPTSVARDHGHACLAELELGAEPTKRLGVNLHAPARRRTPAAAAAAGRRAGSERMEAARGECQAGEVPALHLSGKLADGEVLGEKVGCSLANVTVCPCGRASIFGTAVRALASLRARPCAARRAHPSRSTRRSWTPAAAAASRPHHRSSHPKSQLQAYCTCRPCTPFLLLG